jgi:molybdopterin converting factor small subunit
LQPVHIKDDTNTVEGRYKYAYATEAARRLLYFASASSYTSKDSETLQAPLRLSKLFSTLEKQYTGITVKVLESCLVTVNLEYVDMPREGLDSDNETTIQEGDEVAIIPHVSAG